MEAAPIKETGSSAMVDISHAHVLTRGETLPAWLRRWLGRRDPRVPAIRPERLPDHLRRDLGFSDGRSTRPRDPLRD